MKFDALPVGWKVEPVSALASPEKYSCVGGPFGSSLTRKDYVEYEGVPVSRGSNLKIGSRVFVDEDFVYVSSEKAEKLSKNSAGRGDIILTQRGTIGQVAIIPDNSRYERYILSQNQMKITLDPSKVNPKYFLYYFLSKEVQNEIQRIAIGGVIPGFNLTQFREFEVIVPPLNVQNEIVAILDSLDSKIELNRQTNQTLEHMAQAIFKSWFVDFEPTRAKIAAKEEWAKRSITTKAGGSDNNIKESQAEATFVERAAMAAISGRAIDSTNDSATGALAGLDQLNPEQIQQLKTTAALFPDTLVDSELGEIPEEWGIKKTSDVCNATDFVANGSFKALKDNVTLYDEKNEVIYVRTTDFNKNYSSNLKFTDLTSYSFLKKSKLFGRETIISNVGDVGTVFRAPCWLDLPMTLGSNAIAIISEESNAYIFWLFRSHKGQNLLQGIISGSAQLKFNKTSFRSLEVIWPSSDLLKIFEDLEVDFHTKFNSNMKEIDQLEKLRDLLLLKLLSGELKVS
jgi:type I restriction enzyme S subunit